MTEGDSSAGETIAVILARMEVKLDHALNQGADHETRIRVLEKKIWAASGLAGLLSGGGAAYISQLLGG